MATERFIENNVIRNRAQFGYANSAFIRRCRAGRGFGIVDVLLLPNKGPHRIVLIEAKRATSVDATSKVIGQLLLYYAGALHFGRVGVDYLRDFASDHPRSARSTKPKLLKTLTCGITPPEAAWHEIQMGRKVRPSQIAMYIALDALPSAGLIAALDRLAADHALRIGVLSVLRRDQIEVVMPA